MLFKKAYGGRMKKRVLEKIFLFVLILSLPMLSVSCSLSRNAPDISLLRSPFTGELTWRFRGEEFGASFACDGNGGSAIELLYPTCLAGISVLVSPSGDAVMSHNGSSLGKPPLQYLYIVRALDTRGAFDPLGSLPFAGGEALCYSNSSTNARWYFSPADGRPVGIDGQDLSIEIVWIEPK